VRRHNSSIEDLRSRTPVDGVGHAEDWQDGHHTDGWFDARFLSVTEEEVYGEVREPELPDLPQNFTDVERQVVLLCYRGVLMREIDRELGLSAAQRRRVLESARDKLEQPTAPLPDAAPRRVRLAA
jgi:hypothetical protein